MRSQTILFMSILDNETPMETSPSSSQSFWSGSPKNMFFMGLILGFAISAVMALMMVLCFVWRGKGFGASAPGPVAVVANNPPPAQQPDEIEKPVVAGPVAEVTDKDHMLGNKNAKVTIVEYSDFECTFCSRHEPTIKQLLKTYPKDVRLVYRHYPLSSIHPQADRAAEASECAAKLGGNNAFWKMHEKLFTQAASAGLNPDVYATLAKAIGLDQAKFKTCLDSGEMKAVVQAQAATGNDAGVNGTPANFINGKLLSGAQPYSVMDTAVKSAGAKE